MTRASILFCFVLALLLAASPARAQSPEDRAAADALYSQAGELMKAQRFADACPKLETSQRLDPGIGTLIRLGFCFENIGRTASAWSAYNEAEALARRKSDKRADDAAGRAKALEPKLSRLTITPKSPAPGLQVRRDGKALDGGLWGVAVPVDPGEHALEASAPGRRPWASKVTIAGPGTTTADVPQLAEGPPDAAPEAAPFWRAQRIAGAVVGGAGLVTIAVSLGFGASAKGSNSDSLPHCLPNDPNKCYAPGVAARNNALASADVATGIFLGGAVALGAGLITFFTVPPAATAGKPATGLRVEVRPTVGLGSGALIMSGEW